MIFIIGYTPTDNRAIALGLFDGLHLGHQEVIKKTVSYYTSSGIETGVFTFITNTVPIKSGVDLDFILSTNLKHKYLEDLGVRCIFSPDFASFCDYSGQQFVNEILKEKLSARYVVCGNNFKFGKGAAYDVLDLTRYCEAVGIDVVTVPPLFINGEAVSSTRIRQMLRSGDVESANQLLGRPYEIYARVVHGNEIGRTINFPTINQCFETRQLVPKHGVYISETRIEGQIFNSVTNIGVNPTINGERMALAETHIIGFTDDLYEQNISVFLHDFIRPEQKFNSLDELKYQIKQDLKRCKKWREI